MKQPPCATSLPPSRLCRILLLVFSLKLTVLGLMIFEPELPGMLSLLPGFSTTRAAQSEAPAASGTGAAYAATGEGAGAGAPPSLEVPLPDVGMQRPSPGSPSSSGAPGAVPGVSGGAGAPAGTTAPEKPERALPAIGTRPEQSNAGNGTGSSLSRDALARKQEDLLRKEQELRTLEGEISAKLEKMQILENRLAIMIKDAEETNDAKFRHLVDVLSNMKAKQAAAVLETLDQKVAVRVLAGMRGRQAGEILSSVKPEIAASLTEALARMQLPFE